MTKQIKNKIIIDTDPGHDDALAILLMEKSTLFDIKGITTVAGNCTVQEATNNARYILNLISSKTPIYSGASKPLSRELIQAVVHGEGGLAGAKVQIVEKLSNNAVKKIIEIVRANPNQVSLLVIGPQTNIAQAFIKDPELPSLIKELVLMGGAISVPGNKNRVAEFNIFVDPEAADIVFKAKAKKTIIPLDICNDVYLLLSDFEQLKGSEVFLPVMSMMKEYISGIKKFENTTGALMYDPLAAYYLINPKAYETVEMDIKIETTSELTRGMTVAEKRIWGDKNYNVNVVTKIDRNKFVSDFINILKK